MSEKIKIYFASPLFSEMELMYNTYLVNKLRDKLGNIADIYLPQENESINDKSAYADSIMIANADTEKLVESDLVVAILDGATIDVGVASEIGVAYAKGIPVVALYSDTRQGAYGNEEKVEALDEIAESQFSYINLYTVGLVKSCGVIVDGSEELIQTVDKEVRLMMEENGE